MITSTQQHPPLFAAFLSERTKHRSERVIIYLAIASFLIHLLLIGLVDLQLLSLNDPSQLLTNPIAAVYTPFSFILVYEVYLLVYYLPFSITTYIGKQYEIILLILIRRLFKDLSGLDLNASWFQNREDLQFTVDIIATTILFFLILIFNRLNGRRKELSNDSKAIRRGITREVKRFIWVKKALAVMLVPTLLGLALYSLGDWISDSFFSVSTMVNEAKDVNSIFFDVFFTILIMVDVLLLLFSLLHTDQFHKVIRNSGFIISTILIRLSFGVEGLLNVALITTAVLFGVAMLWVHNRFEQLITSEGVPLDDDEVAL